jgi:hypothetical protein
MERDPLEVIFAARRICENCNREFLIVDDQPQKVA